jgi:putative ABC transport system permease protein
MKREPSWRRYLRFFGADPVGDVDDEVQFHIETKIEELIATGCPPQQARAEALRQFGPVRPIRRECARISRGRQVQASRAEYFAGWLRDVRYAARSLSRSKASTITAILILAVGIGANTAVFSLLDRLLLAPLPAPHPSQLLLLSASSPPQDGKGERIQRGFTGQAFDHLRERNQTLSGIAAEANGRLTERRGHEKIEHPAEGTVVSGNYFQVLGIGAQLGRVLTAGDGSPWPCSAIASGRAASTGHPKHWAAQSTSMT